MHARNQQFSKRDVATPDNKPAPIAYEAVLATINNEQGITPRIVQFFLLLQQDDWQNCLEVMALIHQDRPDWGSQLVAKAGVNHAIIQGSWIIGAHDQSYVAINRDTRKVVDLTNFQLRIEQGFWFEQERETWLAGHIEIAQHSYPISLQSADLERSSAFLAACQFAVFAGAVEEQMTQPRLLQAEHAAGLLQLLRQQAQNVSITRGVSVLGWNKKRTAFTAPTWTVDERGWRKRKVKPHPENALFNTVYDFNEVVRPTPPQIFGPAASLLAALVALLRRGYHAWPCSRINLRYSSKTEQLLQALFKPLNQQRAITAPWSQVKNGLSGYPVYAVDTCAVPEDYPAFCWGPDGVIIPEHVLTLPELQHISTSAQDIMTRVLPHIMVEKVHLCPEPADDFFKLALEGQAIINACYGAQVVDIGKGYLFWQYLSEIPLTELAEQVVLDIQQQAVYFYFAKSGVRRRDVRDELLREYPATKANMYGERYIQVQAMAGMELLEQFYGNNLPIAKRSMAESSAVGEDSAAKSSLKPSA